MDKGIAAVVGGEGEKAAKKKRECGEKEKGIFPNLPKMTLLGD